MIPHASTHDATILPRQVLGVVVGSRTRSPTHYMVLVMGRWIIRHDERPKSRFFAWRFVGDRRGKETELAGVRFGIYRASTEIAD